MAQDKQIKTLLSWKSLSFPDHERGLLWHIGIIIVTLSLVAYAVFYEESWSMAAVMGLLGLVVFIYSKAESREINNALESEGLRHDGKFYSYKKMKSFYFIEAGSYRTLYLEVVEPKKKLLKIFLGDTSASKVRDILKKHLPENNKAQEPSIDKWARRFKL